MNILANNNTMRELYNDRASRLDLIAPILFAVSGLVVFLIFLRPPALSDQVNYFLSAADMELTRPTHRDLRIGLLFPVAGLIKIFDYSELAYYTVPLLTYIAQAIGIWMLARLQLSRAVSLVACLLYMCTPVILWEVSHLLPDYTAAAILTYAFYLIALVHVRKSEGRPLTRNGEMISYLTAGLLVGWAYLVREYVVILFPVMGLMILYFRAHWTRWIAFGSAALACFVVELIWNWRIHGDPLTRFHAVSSPRQTEREFSTDAGEILYQLFGSASTAGGPIVEYIYLIGMLSLAVLLIISFKRYFYFAAWGVIAWVFFTSVALLPLIVLGEGEVYLRLQKFRYWAMLLPPLYIGAAVALFALPRLIATRALANAGPPASVMGPPLIGALASAALIAPLFLEAKSLSERSAAFVRNGNDSYQQFREFLRHSAAERDRIWVNVDHLVDTPAAALPIYAREWHGLSRVWNGEFQPYSDRLRPTLEIRRISDRSPRLRADSIATAGQVAGGLVAFDLSRTRRQNRLGGYALASEHGWDYRPVFTSTGRNAGAVVVLDTEQTLSFDRPDRRRLPTDQIDGPEWILSAVESERDETSEGVRFFDLDDGRYGTVGLRLEGAFAPGLYTVEFTVADDGAEPGPFALHRMEFDGSSGESDRYDVRFEVTADSPRFTAPAAEHVQVEQVETGVRYRIHVMRQSEAESLRMRLYPAAGSDYPNLNSDASGAVTILDYAVYYSETED
jgi:hypothetical protein